MDIIDIVLSKKYTDESLKGITGTLAGKNCTIKSATKADGVTTVIFAWTADDGTEKTTSIQVNDGAKGEIGDKGDKGNNGVSVANVEVNANSHLIVTLSDGSTIDAGLIQGGGGTDDYEDLTNKPKIEGTELIGNKTFEDLGIASATDLAQTDGQLQDLADLVGDKDNLPMPNETIIDNIEYVDTKVDALIDDNATGLAKTFSSDKITKTFATLDEVNERIPQYEIMPTATDACGGQVVQFIGTTTSDYIHGYFYECVPQGDNYAWKNIKVQTGANGGTSIDDTTVSETTTYSSKKITDDYYTKSVVDTALGQKASTTTLMNHVGNSDIHVTSVDKSRWDAKSDFDGKYASLSGQPTIPSKTSELQNDSGYQTANNVTTTLADYALKTEIPTNVSQLTNDSNFIDNAVDTLVNYYKKSQVYTQDEINALLSNLTGKLSAKVVTELPTEDISTSTMYLIAVEDQEGVYSQHMYIDNAWVMLGTTSNNFDDYYDKTQIDTKLADKADKNEIPTVPTNVSAFTNDAGYLTSHQSLDEYAKKTELPIVTNDLTNELKAQYDEAVTKEHTHDNKTVLDAITTEKISAYDNASTLAHEHENKIVLDAITQDNLDDYNEAVLNSHNHTNKATIDKFTEAEDGTLLFDGENVKGAQVNDAVTNQTNVWSSKKISDTIAPIEEKAHTHDNKTVIDKFSESDDGTVLYNGEQIASGNLWHGTKAEYDTLAEKDIDTTYIVTDEEDTIADALIDDDVINTQSTWSSEKISKIKNYVTIPLMSFTGSNNLSSIVNVFWDDNNAFQRFITGVTITRWRYIFTGTSVGEGTLIIGNAQIPIVNDQVGIGAAYPHTSNWVTEHYNKLVTIGTNLNFYPRELSIQIEYTV